MILRSLISSIPTMKICVCVVVIIECGSIDNAAGNPCTFRTFVLKPDRKIYKYGKNWSCTENSQFYKTEYLDFHCNR